MGLVPLGGPAAALLEIFIFLALAEILRLRVVRAGLPPIVGDVCVGMALAPVALGGVVNAWLGYPLFQINDLLLIFADFSVIPLQVALLLGTAASATSTAVVIAFLREEKLTDSAGGRFLLGTTAFDDVIGFIVLSAVLSVV